MDSRNDTIGRKRHISAPFASSKRLKADNKAATGATGSAISISSDDSEDSSDQPSVATASDTAIEPSASARALSRAIFHSGAKISSVASNDLVLVAHPLSLFKGEGEPKDPRSISLSALRRTVIDFCVYNLCNQLIGCVLSSIPQQIQLLIKSNNSLCYILHYSTIKSARAARTLVESKQCNFDGLVIPLSAFDVTNAPKELIKVVPVPCREDEDRFARTLTKVQSESTLVTRSKTEELFPDETMDSSRGRISTQPTTDASLQPSSENAQASSIIEPAIQVGMKEGRDQTELDPNGNGTAQGSEGEIEITRVSYTVRLRDLKEEERRLQARYWGVLKEDDLVYCPICSKQGHMEPTCPARTCQHCGVKDLHLSADCPKRKKCARCRERGHDVQSCPSKLARSRAEGFDCDYCHGNHKEEECSWIWRTFDPSAASVIRTLDPSKMNISCYECAASNSGHWGDDCTVPGKNTKKSSTYDMFSAKFADQFVAKSSESALHNPQEFRIKGQGKQPTRNGTGEIEILGAHANSGSKEIDTSQPPPPPPPELGLGATPYPTNQFTPINGHMIANRRRAPTQESYRSVPPPDQQRPIDLARNNYAGRRGGDDRWSAHEREVPSRPTRQGEQSRPIDWARQQHHRNRFGEPPAPPRRR